MAGLTQEVLADRAGLSVRAITDLERGARRIPHKVTVDLLAAALDLSLQDRATLESSARRPLIAPGPAPYRRRTNLPLALTSFVGRDQEQILVRRLLAEGRLVTLTGAGGIGKTRLALQVAATLLPEYSDGVWLVELAPLSDPALVPQAVATVLGIEEGSGQALLAPLSSYLQTRHLLLVLDNCEHLVASCAALADALLRVCPRLSILTTSREALGITGERCWRVRSLALPAPGALLGLDELRACEAVQLFVQRAQAVCPAFVLTARTAELVAQVCRRLDGIPLALELAAACLPALSMESLATRLDDRFRVLTGGSRTALPRQQTLRATLDWSYDLLHEPERILLRRLSVFAGGWVLEAAEVVCAGQDGVTNVLDLLVALVKKSLVLVEEGHESTRYRLLETVREYGREKLAAAGEAVQLGDRHLAWYLTLVVQAAPALEGPEQGVWLERMEVELDNLRAALGWSGAAVERRDSGVRLAVALGRFWIVHGHLREGRRWLESLLDLGGTMLPTLRVQALNWLNLLLLKQGDTARARTALDESRTICAGAPIDAVATVLPLAGMTPSLVSRILLAGDPRQAMALLEAALPDLDRVGDKQGMGWALCTLGIQAHRLGDYTRAALRYEESLAIFEGLGDTYSLGHQLANLANAARDMGDSSRATRLHRESLALRRDLGDRAGIAECFEGLAVIAAMDGHHTVAARLFGAADDLLTAIGRTLEWLDEAPHERTVPAVLQALGEDAFTTAWTAGRAMSLDEAIVLALADHGGVV